MGLVKTRAKARYAFPIGSGLTPIARWDVVPYQRISTTFEVGVIAFSKDGINDVRITINAGEADETTTTVNAMSLNTRTGAWEYKTDIDVTAYTDGNLTLDAVATGKDGGTRILDTVTLRNNNGGTLVQRKAWVNKTSGSDSTGTVDDDTKPYAKISAAISALNTANGSLDGCVVYLSPEAHDSPSIYVDMRNQTEWLTVTADTGGDNTSTSINGTTGGSLWPIDLVHLKNIAINRANLTVKWPLERSAGSFYTRMWLDTCKCTAFDGTVRYSRIRGNNLSVLWSTDSTFDLMDFPQVGRAMRNCTITDTGEDVFLNGEFVVNCVINTIDPGPTNGWHSDVFHWGATSTGLTWENRIVFGLKATGLHYQGMMAKLLFGEIVEKKDIALVNVYFSLEDPIRYDGNEGGALFLYQRPTEHFLMWNCTLRYDGTDPSGEVLFGDGEPAVEQTNTVTQLDIRGCSLNKMQVASIIGEGSTLSDSNVITPTSDAFWWNRVDCTEVDPAYNADGSPGAGSILNDRLNQLVPVDINNQLRNPITSVGAFRGPNEIA